MITWQCIVTALYWDIRAIDNILCVRCKVWVLVVELLHVVIINSSVIIVKIYVFFIQLKKFLRSYKDTYLRIEMLAIVTTVIVHSCFALF